MLQYDTSVKELDLSDNKFGDGGVSALAASLIDNTSIEVLHLNGNLISDEGVVDLFKVLASASRTIKILGLARNVILDGGVTALASALIDNESLVKVGAVEVCKVVAELLLFEAMSECYLAYCL